VMTVELCWWQLCSDAMYRRPY